MSMLGKSIVFLIGKYQKYISPMLGNRCRFHPTCSEYSKQSIIKHGLFFGTIKSAQRIFRCHPFDKGGYDPVEV